MLLIAVALGGCGSLDWDHLTSYAGLGDDKQAAPPPDEAPADTTPVSSAQGAQDQPWTPVGTNDSTKPTTVTASPLASPQTTAATQTYAAPAPQTYAAPQTYVAPAPQTYAAPQAYAAPAPVAKPVPQTVATAQPPVVYAPATTADAAASAPSGTDSFCQAAAQSAARDAASQGFDAATQRNRGVATYNQCVQYGH